MRHRLLDCGLLAGLMWAAIVAVLPDRTRADGIGELRAAFDEAYAKSEKGDYRGAAQDYQRALEMAPKVLGPDHEDTAVIINNLAGVYFNLGRYTEAVPLYQRSLKIREMKFGPEHPIVATTLRDLAMVYQELNEYAQAEPLYQRSLKIREAKLGSDDLLVAETLNSLGLLYTEMGQYERAEPLYRRSLKIRESKLGPDDAEVAACLNNLGMLYAAADQYAQAETYYRRSLKICEAKLGVDHPRVGQTLNNLANLYDSMGRYADAMPLYQRCVRIMQSRLGPDHPLLATSLNNLAAEYRHLGQYAQAEALYQRSLAIRKATFGPDHPDVAASLGNLAILAMEQRKYAEAEPLYQQSLKILESRLGPDHPYVLNSLNALAVLYKEMGRYAEAEPLYQRCLKVWQANLGPDHPKVAMVLNNLGVLHTCMRELPQAEPFLQQALKIRESRLGPDHPDVAITRYNLVLVRTLSQRWNEAVALTEQQRRGIRRHVAHTLPALNEQQQLTFLSNEDTAYLHTALSLGLHQRADAQSVERSAGWVLNGKAVAQEVLAQRSLLANQAADPTVGNLAKQLLVVRRQLAALGLSAAQPGQEAERRRQLQKLEQQEQDLSQQLGLAAGSNTGDPWVELAAVRQALAKDSALIEVARFRTTDYAAATQEHVWLPPHYAAWVIPAAGQGEVSLVDLGEAVAIDDAVQTASKALKAAETTIRKQGEAKAESQLREALQALTRLVLEPLEKHLGQARALVVSPDAALWLVPWGALPLSDGRYAIEKYPIRYVISGRNLVGQAARKSQKAAAPVVFADPDYDLGPADVTARTRAVLRSAVTSEPVIPSYGLVTFSSLPKVGRLPGTAEEAAAIQSSMAHYAQAETVIYEDHYALEGVFKALHGPRVLVMSTHGFFLPDQTAPPANAAANTRPVRPENPLLRCGLLLAGCNRRDEKAMTATDDGILTGLEIVGTDLRGTDLVVLSACETGLGQVRNGEGVAGLRQAFQLAGAHAVVSTLWQIPDLESGDLMNAFFAYLSQGQSKADALRNAQLALIKARRAEHAAAHPFYWAAFTLTGE